MRKKVYPHAAVAIVASEHSREFLFDQYTDTYRVADWRGCINLIGGNQSLNDSSPRGIWEREIIEEFYEPFLSETSRVSETPLAERILIAKNLFANAKPYKDFLVTIPEVMELRNHRVQKRDPLMIVHTVFETFLDQEIFECVRGWLKAGKKIKNEGASVIRGIDDLINGETRSASATGLILEDYLHPLNIKVSSIEGVVVTCLGAPRNSLDEYLSDFEYELGSIDEEI